MLIPFQGQKISKIPSPAYLLFSRLKSGSGRRPLKKREKSNVSNIPKKKEKHNSPTYHSYSKSKSRLRKASPKKKRKRNVNDVPKTKEQRNLHLPFKSKVVQAEIQVQEGVP